MANENRLSQASKNIPQLWFNILRNAMKGHAAGGQTLLGRKFLLGVGKFRMGLEFSFVKVCNTFIVMKRF